MMVIGADPHKRSHTFSAVTAGIGELRGHETVSASVTGYQQALRWARELDGERVWAIEDCRHVSGKLERFLIARGERVVRVPPKLMAGARRSSRERGKSDPIDSLAVARAALMHGVDSLPTARLEGAELELRLLVDHRDRLVCQRTALQNDLRWHLHDQGELDVPTSGLSREKWLKVLAVRLARREQDARTRIARDELRRIREQTRTINALEKEIAELVAQVCPQLLDEIGCGALTAAKLVGEIAGVDRFSSDAKLARTAGVAPIPASSGRRDRQRLDRGGNRQLNCALHRLAVSKARWDPESAAYLARKQAEGKTRMDALRCLKRHLARRVYRLLNQPNPETSILDRPLLLT